MSAALDTNQSSIARFRAKLLIAMTLVAFAITGTGLYFAQRKVAQETEYDLQRDFAAGLAALHRGQAVRHAALTERCRGLVRRPRIHAALEDDATDLLYPNAKDELRDVMNREEEADPLQSVLDAQFYRFLDASGVVISPPNLAEVGALRPEEEAQLALNGAPGKQQQLGYIFQRADDGSEFIVEVIATPIISTETGEVIGWLVLGFQPVEPSAGHVASGMKSGIWLGERLHLPELTGAGREIVAGSLKPVLVGGSEGASFDLDLAREPHRLFYRRLNPDSLFTAAYEVCIYPLTDLLARQAQLRWQAAAVCAVLLLGGVAASHFLAGRLSQPVEQLAIDSEENRAQRRRAETALEMTSAELQRSARFSADASHQLKTPIAVLRAGLEELLAQEHFSPAIREEVSALVHQTFRLTSIVEDLLLLSRLDEGRLQLHFGAVDLTHLIEALLDDLTALPDGLDVEIETDCPALCVAGEQRYVALILQNLLENARKYNRPGGSIRVACREEDTRAIVTIANTGRTIPPEAREHIFERFHRGSAGENIPGHGLGLNLARELARLHGGDLRLVRSDEIWTEFEVRFRLFTSEFRRSKETDGAATARAVPTV